MEELQKRNIKKLALFLMIDQLKHLSAMLSYKAHLNAGQALACSTETSSPKNQQQFNSFCGVNCDQKASQRKSEFTLTIIKEKQSEIDNCKEKRQKSGFDRVLALLKQQRDARAKLKEQKRKCLPELWRGFGALMALQRQKFQSDYLAEVNSKNKQHLYCQLLAKNSNNIKALKQFKKRTQLKSSKNKLNSKDLLKSVEIEQLQQKSCLEQSIEVTLKQNTMYVNKSAERPHKFSTLEKIANKGCFSIKIRSRPMPYRLVSNRTSHKSQIEEIKAKVESAFKSIKKLENLNKNIPNNIVFDPDNIFSCEKKKRYIKNLQKRNFHKQQRQGQSTKTLLRVGGMRLSLQDSNRYRTTQI